MVISLQVTEWKYKGGDLLSFRNKMYTFDVWDFSGAADFRSIYSCFDCSNSLHIVVCRAADSAHDLARWLSDIQVHCSVREREREREDGIMKVPSQAHTV